MRIAILRHKKAFAFGLNSTIQVNTQKCLYRNNSMTEKDNTTKLTRLTWDNFMYIPQKYLKDVFSV